MPSSATPKTRRRPRRPQQSKALVPLRRDPFARPGLPFIDVDAAWYLIERGWAATPPVPVLYNWPDVDADMARNARFARECIAETHTDVEMALRHVHEDGRPIRVAMPGGCGDGASADVIPLHPGAGHVRIVASDPQLHGVSWGRLDEKDENHLEAFEQAHEEEDRRTGKEPEPRPPFAPRQGDPAEDHLPPEGGAA